MEVGAVHLTVAEPTDVATARRHATAVAAALGFDETASGRVALVATELGTNLLKHAGGGEMIAAPIAVAEARGVQMVALDRGHGMNPEVVMRDGFSTAGSPGTGLGAIRRSSDAFDLYTSPLGTVVASTVLPFGPVPDAIGGFSIAAPGESESGDAWAAWSAGELTSIFVVDGLGHGTHAAQAAKAAVEAFLRHAERPCGQVMSFVHEALRHTRGAAVALAELDRRRASVRFCGIGNISARLVAPDGRDQQLVSLSGIAGHVMRRVQDFSYPWAVGSTLVMHSDGLGSHWSLDKHPGLMTRRAGVIAGALYRDHRRGRDDVTVVVARHGDPA